jgi:hypothetical protein
MFQITSGCLYFTLRFLFVFYLKISVCISPKDFCSIFKNRLTRTPTKPIHCGSVFFLENRTGPLITPNHQAKIFLVIHYALLEYYLLDKSQPQNYYKSAIKLSDNQL